MHLAVQILAVVAGALACLSLIPQPADKPYWAYTQGIALLLAAVSLFVIGAR